MNSNENAKKQIEIADLPQTVTDLSEQAEQAIQGGGYGLGGKPVRDEEKPPFAQIDGYGIGGKA